MAKKISDLQETFNVEANDIMMVDKYENGQLHSKKFKLLSIFSKLKTIFGMSLVGSGDIDSPKNGKVYGRKDGAWEEIDSASMNVGETLVTNADNGSLFYNDNGSLGEVKGIRFHKPKDRLVVPGPINGYVETGNLEYMPGVDLPAFLLAVDDEQGQAVVGVSKIPGDNGTINAAVAKAGNNAIIVSAERVAMTGLNTTSISVEGSNANINASESVNINAKKNLNIGVNEFLNMNAEQDIVMTSGKQVRMEAGSKATIKGSSVSVQALFEGVIITGQGLVLDSTSQKMSLTSSGGYIFSSVGDGDPDDGFYLEIDDTHPVFRHYLDKWRITLEPQSAAANGYDYDNLADVVAALKNIGLLTD